MLTRHQLKKLFKSDYRFHFLNGECYNSFEYFIERFEEYPLDWQKAIWKQWFKHTLLKDA